MRSCRAWWTVYTQVCRQRGVLGNQAGQAKDKCCSMQYNPAVGYLSGPCLVASLKQCDHVQAAAGVLPIKAAC